jgi:hypothetical protein
MFIKKSKGPAVAKRQGSSNSGSSVLLIWVILVLTNVQLVRLSYQQSQLELLQLPSNVMISSPTAGSPPTLQDYALAPKTGKAVALPGIRVEKEEVNRDVQGHVYGGKGDKKHLGGFTVESTRSSISRPYVQ